MTYPDAPINRGELQPDIDFEFAADAIPGAPLFYRHLVLRDQPVATRTSSASSTAFLARLRHVAPVEISRTARCPARGGARPSHGQFAADGAGDAGEVGERPHWPGWPARRPSAAGRARAATDAGAVAVAGREPIREYSSSVSCRALHDRRARC